MDKFVFTPGQREEAMKWITQNCSDLIFNVEVATGTSLHDHLIDMYFKLKTVPFSFKPNEFVVGIEYKSEAKIRAGKEVPNVHINNPHKLVAEQFTHDQFALTLLYSLFKNQQI